MSKLYFSKNETESFSTKKTLNNTHKLLIGTLALVLVAGMASPAFALTIDNFNTGTENLEAENDGDVESTTTTGLPADETLGESRFTQVTNVAGGLGSSMAQLLPQPFPMSMVLSSDGNTASIFKLIYDADDAVLGLNGVDLTANGGNQILLDLLSADQGANIEICITDTDDDVSCLTVMVLDIIADPLNAQVMTYLFANFDNLANIDFDSVKMIMVELPSNPAGDFIIDLIGVPQTMVGGTVGSMSTATLLVAGAQANMGLWSLAIVGAVGAGAAIIYKKKSKKTEQ